MQSRSVDMMRIQSVLTFRSCLNLGDNMAVDPFAKFQRLCHIDRMGDISNIVIEIPRRYALSG